jgi:hypothetical protein
MLAAERVVPSLGSTWSTRSARPTSPPAAHHPLPNAQYSSKSATSWLAPTDPTPNATPGRLSLTVHSPAHEATEAPRTPAMSDVTGHVELLSGIQTRACHDFTFHRDPVHTTIPLARFLVHLRQKALREN